MRRSIDRNDGFERIWARLETFARNPNDNRVLRGQVDDLCIELFDRWCERRELAPLVYLLYAWPFFASTRHPVETLAAVLQELLIFHDDVLDDMDRELIANIHELTGC